MSALITPVELAARVELVETSAIAWWGWLLIWTGLVLALLVTLALLLWWLFRKAMTLLDDVGELAEKAEILDVEEVADLPRPAIAVLTEMRDIRAREEARRAHRARRRSDRHQRRMARARRITSVDASARRWPADWY